MTEGITTLLSTACHWLEVRMIGQDVTVNGVCTDSRHITPGCLFIALRGPNHDGHQHVAAAASAGAVAALVEQPVDCVIPQIIVADSHQALGRLAAAWRLNAVHELAAGLAHLHGHRRLRQPELLHPAHHRRRHDAAGDHVSGAAQRPVSR